MRWSKSSFCIAGLFLVFLFVFLSLVSFCFVSNFLASFQHLPDTDQAYDKLLQDLTPIRQHLIVWAACIDEGICLTGASRSIFCQRALAYETSFQSVQTKFGRKYDGSTRHSQLFGQHEKCLSDRPDSPPQ
jgi:hypothetical protein